MAKNKLEIITNSLEQDSRVIVLPFRQDNADSLRQKHIGTESSLSMYEHIIKLYVAPVKGLYTGKQLQEFMENLVPEIKDRNTDTFKQDIKYAPEYFLTLGNLIFHEKYGKERVLIRRECELFDDVFAEDFDFSDKKRTVETKNILDYNRKIILTVYPNEEIGKEALDSYKKSNCSGHGLIGRVTLEKIQEYEPNILDILKKSGQTKFPLR